jgi:hypothetical protein
MAHRCASGAAEIVRQAEDQVGTNPPILEKNILRTIVAPVLIASAAAT